MTHWKPAVGILVFFLIALTFAGVSAATPDNRGAFSFTAPEMALDVPVWQQVNSSGFGDPQTDEITALESFNNYLYAGTHNPIDPAPLYDGAQIFRSSDGLTWTSVTQPGFGNTHDIAPPAILDFAVFKGYLYASTGRGNASQLWRSSNGTTWAPMDVTGFSDPDNVDITALTTYNSMIYAGVKNRVTGAQIWRSFTGGNNSWTQVAPDVPGTIPASVTGFVEFGFDGGLYAAVESEEGPAQIWRSYGSAWEIVVNDGFGDTDTIWTGGITEFLGDLYAGTGNSVVGAQLWRSTDGDIWTQIITPAFGDANNLKVEMVMVFENQLYVSVKNTATGMEIWRSADGSVWEQVNQDGFGDSNNTTTNWSNASAKFSNQLYVGTLNVIDGGEIWRMQPPYDVTLSADQSLSGPVGGQVSYILTITNIGTTTDSIDLSATGQTWTTTLSTSPVNLAPSTSTTFTVTVDIPPDANNLDTDSVTITAASQGDTSKTDTAVLTTTSISSPVYGVALSADDSLSGPVGNQVSYSLTITNTGNVVDTFNLLFSGNSWVTNLSTLSVNLAPFASKSFTATVTIPPDANDQETDSVTITATSQGDISKTDTAVLTTTSITSPVYGVALSVNDSLSGPAGEQVSYSLTITNTGNVVDTFDLYLTGNSWTTTPSSKVVNLDAATSEIIMITVSIPAEATASESDQVTVQATSRHDSSKNDSAVLTTVSLGKLTKIYLPVVLINSPQ